VIERVVAVVARNAELRSWPPGEAATVLSMLGVDAREAKQALRASRRRRWVQSLVPKPSRPPAEQLGAISGRSWIASPVAFGYRRADGRFKPAEICVAGLHELVGHNRMERPDRSSVQCRECTTARKSSPENLARRRARAKERREL
jgi:hypothetical protein